MTMTKTPVQYHVIRTDEHGTTVETYATREAARSAIVEIAATVVEATDPLKLRLITGIVEEVRILREPQIQIGEPRARRARKTATPPAVPKPGRKGKGVANDAEAGK